MVIDRLGALWALILAKCFLAQWAIGRFAIPVNGLIYIWTLTLTMALLATAYYLHAHRIAFRFFPTQVRVGSAGLLGLVVALGFVAYVHLGLNLITLAAAVGLSAALLGSWSILQVALRRAGEPLMGALVWWGVALMALHGRDADGLLWIGAGFLFAQAFPGFVLCLRMAREKRV
ncbi:MAG: hypothetical protein D4R66_04995 [Opitutales bacterium]|nr:MAG: hypothetical protein D4R66_04995 [Opitutales bacterium]